MGGYKFFLIYLITSAFFAFKRCQAAERNVCGTSQKIPCDNSECILRHGWCDGERNCADGSDEEHCKKEGWFTFPDNHCTEKHFVCGNGPCIPVVAKCDSFKDCGDYSDEKNCEETSDGNLGYSVTLAPEEKDRSLEPAPPEIISRDNTTDSVNTYDAAAYWRSSTTFYERRWEESVDATQPSPYLSSRNGQYPPNYYSQNPHLHSTYGQYPPNNYRQNPHPSSTYGQYPPNNHRQNSHLRSTYGLYLPNNHRQNPHPSSTYGQFPPNNYGQNPNGQLNYHNQRYQGVHHNNGGSDIAPGQHLPASELSFTPWPSIKANAMTPSPDIFRAGHDRNSIVGRQRPMIIQPRSVLHPPAPRQLYYARNKPRSAALPLFHFASNYTEQIGYNYERNVVKAKQWLISQRNNSSYDWGGDTPRVLVALSLITNSFVSDTADNDLMKKGLQIHLGQRILRSKTPQMPITKLALYINSLLATCQNPRDFISLDLVDALYKRRYELKNLQSTVSPLVYLTLCLSNISFDEHDLLQLQSLLTSRFLNEIEKDRHILAIAALSCVLQQNIERSFEMRPALYQLAGKMNDAIQNLLNQQKDDGSFGSVYSTAIAAQALMSTNLTTWDPRPTLNYLARHQSDDGSFGDMLSTYYSLIALSGRSLVHLRNTQCDQPNVTETFPPDIIWDSPGPKKNVLYSVAIGYPERLSFSMQLAVPENTSLFDIMRVAEYLDPRFTFRFKINREVIEVYSIYNVPNDPERKLYWNLYELEATPTYPINPVDLTQRYTGDVKSLIPRDSQELLWWFLQTD